MTAGSLTVHIMRPRHCWTILQVSIVTVLLLALNAESEDSSCEIEIRVRRNTVYNASLGEDFRINCTVEFCNNSPPAVSWFKNDKMTNVPVNISSSSHIKTEWTQPKDFTGTSFLIFKNILISDSGEYQCRLADGLTVSHVINVFVYDGHEPTNVTQKNETNNEVMGPEPTDPLWMYLYTAAGILAFVIIVIIISVAVMHRCKGKSKKETRTDNQYMAVPMVEQPSRLQVSPRGSPSAPPSRRSTRKKKTTSQPNELPLPRDNEHLYGEIKEDRETQRNTVEEEASSIVYAALNHQLPAGAAARPRRQVEEMSEYAAIRIKDH